MTPPASSPAIFSPSCSSSHWCRRPFVPVGRRRADEDISAPPRTASTKGATMLKRAFATLLVTLLACAPAAAVSPATPKRTVIAAVKHQVETSSRRKVWTQGLLECVSPGGSGTSWLCDSPMLHASVSFRLKAGTWKLERISILCKTAGTTPATGCK